MENSGKQSDVFGSDLDSEVELEQPPAATGTVKPSVNELFGSDDDDDEGDDDAGSSRPTRRSVINDDDEEDDEEDASSLPKSSQEELTSSSSRPDVKSIFGEDLESEEPAVRQRGHSNLRLPAAPASAARQVLVRMPAFVGIQDAQFDEQTHDARAEEEQFKGASALVRWRQVLDAQGRPAVESNARVVKYTDGTMQLIVGDAVFEADLRPLNNTYTFAQVRSARVGHDDGTGTGSGRPSECFEGTGALDAKLSLRPSSLSSETHKRMVAHMLSQTTRANASKVRMGRGYNPEQTRQSREREDDERIKRERRTRDQGEARVRVGGRRGASMSASYLEEGDNDAQYDTVNVSRVKNRGQYRDYYEDDDGEMDDFIVDDDEEGDENDDEHDWQEPTRKQGSSNKAQDDDDEEEQPARGKRGAAVTADDDDDEEETYQPKKRSRAAAKIVDESDED